MAGSCFRDMQRAGHDSDGEMLVGENMAAICLEHVSKRFTLRHERPRSLQEVFVNAMHLRHASAKERFWALHDVSFETQRGEMLGVIGENGAGKSTLLKLLTRILEPTSGRIEVNGRIGALLELGAGFHPDLTGRENIFLNGSILGLSRDEINVQLDDIIAFAEVERFIDVPVRHYSSGMLVRLGFSTAIHTRPDILLVDEVLAVGDAAFQQRCVEKIAELRRGDCTIVFVSHELEYVRQLCNRAIWLEDGQIQQMGEAQQVVTSYAASAEAQVEGRLRHDNVNKQSAARGRGEIQILEVKMVDHEGNPRWSFRSGEPVCVHIAYESTRRVERPVFSLLIHRSDGLYVTSTNTSNIDPVELGPIEGQGELVVRIERLDLYKGDYFLSAGAYLEPDPPHWSTPAHFLDKQFQFRIISEGQHGVLVIPARWKHRHES